jgi:hypothetical protein
VGLAGKARLEDNSSLPRIGDGLACPFPLTTLSVLSRTATGARVARLAYHTGRGRTSGAAVVQARPFCARRLGVYIREMKPPSEPSSSASPYPHTPGGISRGIRRKGQAITANPRGQHPLTARYRVPS